ncbi:VTT domain-containing protein [Streptomyces sp. F63]|uniref:DedA family protein n=1 Tax=Streptomyces sp. F63 TaxID=2824887 RepID=UPI001B38BA4A|nr:VTT domain-containing protein [Streptomyces sp. F63]MBQ0984637.1 VTT domain-containing protein [Streptomyces sp. F63]
MDSAHWMYALLIVVTMPPMVPNSALLTGAGALAATGGLSLAPLAAILLASATLGDLGVFWLGRRSRGRALAWMSRNARRRSTLEWTAQRIQRYGVPSVIAIRFVPTGRGTGGVAAGIMGYPLHKYLVGAGIAEALFLSYTIGFGYLGGRALPDVPPFLIGPALSLLVAGSVVIVQGFLRPRPNTYAS